jgi:hypothetical protein
VNVSDALKRTPLHVAASEGQVIVTMTFALVFDISASAQLILFCLCFFSQLVIVKYLIENGSDVNAEDKFKNTCLNDAVRHM